MENRAKQYARPATNPFLEICSAFIGFTTATGTREHVRIGTLGPAGTSSDYAAHCFLTSTFFGGGQCNLYNTYEDAAQSVADDGSDLLIVANAYSRINEIYISHTLRLTTFFVLDTLPYGLATRTDVNALGWPQEITIATHPAPAHLASWFIDNPTIVPKLRLVQSTSEAAMLAAEGTVDACITNDFARESHGLAFRSRTRPIQMLWSVFKSKNNDRFPSFMPLVRCSE